MWSIKITTIACNKESIACDLQYTDIRTGVKWKGNTKVYKFEANENTYSICDFYIGFAGTAQDIVTLAEFFSYPEEFQKPPKVSGLLGLVLTEQKDIFVFDHYAKWLKLAGTYHAIGSGASVALGAMAAGATPKDAIKHASKIDTYTGMGIKSFNF